MSVKRINDKIFRNSDGLLWTFNEAKRFVTLESRPIPPRGQLGNSRELRHLDCRGGLSIMYSAQSQPATNCHSAPAIHQAENRHIGQVS